MFTVAAGAAYQIAQKVPIVNKVVPHISLATPSQNRASAVIGKVIASANAGNLTAAKCIQERTGIGISKERAVWSDGLSKVSAGVLANVEKYAGQIPPVDHTSPESAADSALANPFYAEDVKAGPATVAKVTEIANKAADAVTNALGGGGDNTALYVVGGLLVVGVAIVALQH